MYIERVRLRGFGKLAGTFTFEQRRPNIICQANEFGKTTLADAILYTLYNFPAGRGRSGELKPRDKYRPCGNGKADAFATELELADVDGHDYRLAGDFTLQQPFELAERNTGRTVPLEGMSFGKRFFRMPLQTFTDCFFLRQDEAEGSRDDLVQLIEEAAASNRRTQDSPVRNALVALSECRVHLEEFTADAVRPDYLLKCIERRLDAARTRLSEICRERERLRAAMAGAEEMDARIARLRDDIMHLEYAAMLTELAETEQLARQQEGLENAVRQRRQRIDNLAAYAGYDPSLLPRVQELHAELLALRRQHMEQHGSLEERTARPLRQVEEDIAALPAGLSAATRDDLERLRLLKTALVQQGGERERMAAERDRIREELRVQGIDVDSSGQTRQRLGGLPPTERQALLGHESEMARLRAACADAERRRADAAARTAAAKAGRDKLGVISTIWFMAAFIMVLLCLLFIVVKALWASAVWFAFASFVGAVACGVAGVLAARKGREHSSTSLDPAVADEASAASEVRRIHEQMEAAETAFAETLKRRGLSPGDISAVREASSVGDLTVPYQAAHESVARLDENLARTAGELCERIAACGIEATPQTLDVAAVETAIRRVERCLGAHAERERLAADHAAAQRGLDDFARRIARAEEALGDLIGAAVQAGIPIDDRVAAFIDGCQKAIRFCEASEDTSVEELAPASPPAEYRQRCDTLRNRIREMENANTGLRAQDLPDVPRARVVERLEQVRRDYEELRQRRADTFGECDRAVETWRREGPGLQEEIERLTEAAARITEFREALRIAHDELSAIAEQVFAQWAGALNTRVSEILSLINPVYRDVRLSEDLEPGLYSVDLGRRLAGHEIQHLSRGARDQLNLAVRVAIAEYLSAHIGSLPIVLDEPFAHWDDQRFAAGMDFLTALTARHQVVVLTCQQWRFRELQRNHPELYAGLHFCSQEALPDAK